MTWHLARALTWHRVAQEAHEKRNERLAAAPPKREFRLPGARRGAEPESNATPTAGGQAQAQAQAAPAAEGTKPGVFARLRGGRAQQQPAARMEPTPVGAAPPVYDQYSDEARPACARAACDGASPAGADAPSRRLCRAQEGSYSGSEYTESAFTGATQGASAAHQAPARGR
jgi:hypothetical protein